MRIVLALATGLIALGTASVAAAQAGTTVPPSKKQAPATTDDSISRAADEAGTAATVIDTIGLGASEYGEKLQKDGAFMESRTGRILGRHELGSGDRVAAQGARLGKIGAAASTGATGLDVAAKVVGYYDKSSRGDIPGLAQDFVEDAIEFGTPRLVCGPAAPVCAPAYAAGQAVGSGINSLSKWVSGETLQDHMTDMYYSGYERIGKALNPSQDPDSEEFERNVREKIAENKARFAQSAKVHQARNQELAERNRLSEQAFDSSLYSPLGSNWSDPTAGTSPLAEVPSNSSAEEDIDPATGCHRGHDESRHPGGCRDYSRGEPTSAAPTGTSLGDPTSALFVGPPAPPK